MDDVIAILYEKARKQSCHIVLSEGEDLRILQGAAQAVELGLSQITLLGDQNIISQRLIDLNLDIGLFNIINPRSVDVFSSYIEAYQNLRKPRQISLEQARLDLSDPLVFAAMMVRLGDADGTIGGAVATTSDTVRAALRIVGKANGVKQVTSIFLMIAAPNSDHGRSAYVFADGGVVIEPNADELSQIGYVATQAFRELTDQTPKTAFLSFSSLGSARHAKARKIAKAAQLFSERQADVVCAGEVQFDAAFVPHVAKMKIPDASLRGDANVFIFPNLEAANIGYKIAQRVGGVIAIGPILQGLAKPANDLSRGCDARDVCLSIAVTAIQAQSSDKD